MKVCKALYFKKGWQDGATSAAAAAAVDASSILVHCKLHFVYRQAKTLK